MTYKFYNTLGESKLLRKFRISIFHDQIWRVVRNLQSTWKYVVEYYVQEFIILITGFIFRNINIIQTIHFSWKLKIFVFTSTQIGNFQFLLLCYHHLSTFSSALFTHQTQQNRYPITDQLAVNQVYFGQ